MGLARQAAKDAGRDLPVTSEERELRGEQSKLSKQRRALFKEIAERYEPLRHKQGELARSRASITAQRGRKALPTVTNAERKLRAQIAELDQAKAVPEGRARRDRELADALDAIYETVHDPASYSSDDW